MNSEVLALVGNLLIKFLFIYIYLKMKPNFKLGLMVLLISVISSTASIIFYYQPYASWQLTGNISFPPLLYWNIVFFINMLPIFYFDCSKIQNIKYDIVVLKRIIIIGFWVSVIPCLEQITIIPSMLLGSGIQNIGGTMVDLHDNNTLDSLSFISRNLLRANIAIYDLSFLILLLFIIQQKVEKKFVIYIIVILLTRNLTGLIGGHRGALIEVFQKLLIISVIALNFLDKKRKFQLLKSLSIGLGVIVAFFAIITIARQIFYQDTKSNDFTMLYFLSRYMGEGFILFSQHMPQIDNFTYGDLTFYSLKSLLGADIDENNFWFHCSLLQKIPQNVFFTYIGNFIQDFGFIGAFIWLVISTIFIRRFTSCNSHSIPISSLYLLVFWTSILSYGFTSYQYNLQHGKFVIFTFIVFFYLRSKKI